MMKKEFEIDDILNAVNSISKKEKRKSKTVEKKDFTGKYGKKILSFFSS